MGESRPDSGENTKRQITFERGISGKDSGKLETTLLIKSRNLQ